MATIPLVVDCVNAFAISSSVNVPVPPFRLVTLSVESVLLVTGVEASSTLVVGVAEESDDVDDRARATEASVCSICAEDGAGFKGIETIMGFV